MRRTGQRTTGLFGLLVLVLGLVGPARAEPPSLRDLQFMDAVTWGVNGPTMRAFEAAGRERWLDGQLEAAAPRLPPDAQGLIERLHRLQPSARELVLDFDARSKAANAIPDPDARDAARQAFQLAMSLVAREAITRLVLRGLYAENQLSERLAWFWFNHFNVFQQKANLRLLVGDYEERAIRPHVLGRFRDLLAATTRHPAMLRYLDNADNAAGHLNENHAREILELHTMGVGSGYTQHDVQEFARILTGLGIDASAADPKLPPGRRGDLVRDGLFEFNPARHDYGDKVFLGHLIKGRGLAELDEVLDILSRHPATARHICRALAVYFVADQPDEELVRRMAEVFTRTDGNIAAVMRTLLVSPEFEGSLGRRFKDPVRFLFSAMRLAYDDKLVLNAWPIQQWLNKLAQPLYGTLTPNGYPLDSSFWSGSGQMIMRFEIAWRLGAGAGGLFRGEGTDPAERAGVPVLRGFPSVSLKATGFSAATRDALRQATSPQEWNFLFLSSPEFMQ